MNKLLTKVAKLLLGLSLAAGVGVAVGNKAALKADASDVTVAFSSFGLSGSTGSGTESTSGYGMTISAGTSSNGIAKNGTLQNTTALPGSITSVTVTGAATGSTKTDGTFEVFGGTASNSITTSMGQETGLSSTASNRTVNFTGNYTFFKIVVGSARTLKFTSLTISYSTTPVPTTYSVTYDANGATSGTVPTDATAYASGATVTVKGNTGNLAKTGYTFGGWNTKADGTGTNYAAGSGTFTISAATTLYAKWNADTLNSLSISGSMTKTQYKVNDAWDPTGFTVTANYQSGNQVDVTSSVSWTYSPANATSTSVTAMTATASFGGKSVTSSSQTVTVTDGVTYNLANISGFSSWTNSYTTHTVTHSDVGASISASMTFSITNKQGSGVGSTYPCIGAKTNSELECLTFTLTQSGKKITSIDIVFVTRYTSTYPSFYLHKGSGIATTPLETLTMNGAQESEHSLSVANLNDTVFTVGYNAHQTGSNGATGIKSISIGLVDLSSFGTLDHISVTGLPNVVYHVGETFDSTGFAVTAYDGANEATANFKDITASVETDLDNPTPFVDSDVPGFDCDVSYTGDGGSDTTSFHVYVYALAEYDLVTEELTDWSGEYLIVSTDYNSDLVAMNGGLANPDTPKGYKVVTDSADSIETGQELEWVIAKVTGGYSIQGKSGKYIGSLTAASNGMLISETPLVNTISYSDDAVSITGTNGYSLKIYNETSSSRFRYYSSGSVQLYKLKESNAALAYAETFLGAFTCDASGANAPSFTIKEGSTYWTWSLLATEYNTLTAVEKEEFRLGVASESGDEIGQALARYDYVVGKYFKTGVDTSFTDFMSRNPQAIVGARLALANISNNNTNTIAIIVIISLVSVTAIGGYFFIKRREQN